MRDGISLFSGDAKTSSLLKSFAWVWLGWGEGWLWAWCTFSTPGFVLVLVWKGYSYGYFTHIMWLCSETVSESSSFIVSVCLELYLPISRSVLLFMVVTSSQMLLGPSSTELHFYLLITEATTCNSPFKELVEGQWGNLWQGKSSLPGQPSFIKEVPSISKANAAVWPHSNTNMEFPLHFMLLQKWKHIFKGH